MVFMEKKLTKEEIKNYKMTEREIYNELQNDRKRNIWWIK